MIDINDRIDLSPEIWGHNGWFFLDSICLSYPLNPSNEMKENCKSFFYLLPKMLPCDKCRDHFKQYITEYPLDDDILKSKDSLLLWILNAHNNVNKRNGKNIITLEQFKEYYDQKYKDTCSSCKPTKKNIVNMNVFGIIMFGMIIALGLYLYRSFQKDSPSNSTT